MSIIDTITSQVAVPSLEDLNTGSYLKSLDQDSGRGKGSRGLPRTEPGANGAVTGGKPSAPLPAPSPPPVDPSIPSKYQHLPSKAVKTAFHIIDQMIARAVRSGEVRMDSVFQINSISQDK